MTYILASGTGEGGDKYGGLDRFGRVIDQRWLKNAGSVDLDRFGYGFDRNGNRLYRDNLLTEPAAAAFDELYHSGGAGGGYDQLNQLTAFKRGTLNGTKDDVDGATRTQTWSLDAQDNWDSVTTNNPPAQTRTHNKQNQILTVSDQTPPAYDNNGNLKTDETNKQLSYDAWNRLVSVTGGSAPVSYAYDALGRRVKETVNTTTTDLYYSSSWRVLEERQGTSVKAHYLWSPVYVDALVLRDRDTDATPGFDETVYVLQDANYNVTALVNTAGTVVERYVYDPYGAVTVLDINWQAQSPSLYSGKYLHQGGRYDVTTGLYHFRNRDLSPTLGRWIQRDPIEYNAGDTNLYRYVFNSPTNARDPSGLVPPWLENIGSGAVDILRGFFCRRSRWNVQPSEGHS